METKLAAARIANDAHRPAVIANGRTPAILDMICAGKPVGTLFLPPKTPPGRGKPTHAHRRGGGGRF